MNTSPQLFSTSQVAAHLNVTPRNIRYLCGVHKDQEIGFKVSKSWLFTSEDVDKLKALPHRWRNRRNLEIAQETP
jgi:hypothetical protein